MIGMKTNFLSNEAFFWSRGDFDGLFAKGKQTSF
jgi:hypothetical protein